MIAVAEEDGTRLGVAGIHVADPVHFLVSPGILMFFDHIVQVIIDRSAGHQACLGPAGHDLLVKVEAGTVVLHEDARRDLALQELCRFGVDSVVIGTDTVIELGLRPVDPEEGEGIALDFLLCLLPAEHVIGKGRHQGFHAFSGPVGLKGTNICHKRSPFVCLNCILFPVLYLMTRTRYTPSTDRSMEISSASAGPSMSIRV